jgi:hypothetical protein
MNDKVVQNTNFAKLPSAKYSLYKCKLYQSRIEVLQNSSAYSCVSFSAERYFKKIERKFQTQKSDLKGIYIGECIVCYTFEWGSLLTQYIYKDSKLLALVFYFAVCSLSMGHLGKATCTVHLISDPNQSGRKRMFPYIREARILPS